MKYIIETASSCSAFHMGWGNFCAVSVDISTLDVQDVEQLNIKVRVIADSGEDRTHWCRVSRVVCYDLDTVEVTITCDTYVGTSRQAAAVARVDISAWVPEVQ